MKNIYTKQQTKRIGPHAPHLDATPSSWYYNATNIPMQAPRTPHFNVKTYNHHDWISTNPELESNAIYWVDYLYRDRLRSLLSVDDIVTEVIQYLESTDMMNNTYILFSSGMLIIE